MARLPRKYNQQRHGQALLIAVLIMFAILLAGALFVAIVNYNQQSSVRHSDMIAAQGLAEAGIRYADYMLQYSAQGADWRPPFPPRIDTDGVPVDAGFYDYYTDMEEQRGWCPLIDAVTVELVRFGYTRYPDPLNPSDNLNIGRGHFFLRVTYDPDPPYEPNDPPGAPVDPLSKYIKIEAIGVVDDEGFVFRQLVAYKPIALTDYLLFVTDRSRRAQPTILGYNPWIDMNKDNSLNFFTHEFHGPMRFNTSVQLEGQNSDPTAIPPDPAAASTTIYMATAPTLPRTPDRPGEDEGGGYLRDDRFETMYNVSESYAVGTNFNVDGTDFQLSNPNPPPPGALQNDHVIQGADHLQAPQLFAKDPATGTMRWYALTRDSGVVVLSTYFVPSETVNVGQYGHGQGIYIDNVIDVQFPNPDGTQNIELLIQDWLHNVPPTDPRSGWNDVGEMYDPIEAVQIELFADWTSAQEYSGLVGDTFWHPDVPSADEGNVPLIRIRRYDNNWQLGDPGAPATVGDDSVENTMYSPYPLPGHQVIFAEGNIRISGRLPRDDSGTGRYNLTVVSGGTIYIDGQILSPQDQYGRHAGRLTDTGVPDEENTYIALLARDCVVVNPTMLVPQAQVSGTTPLAEPDPYGMHWTLHYNTTDAIYGRWYFGAIDPTHTINLVVRQTGDAAAETELMTAVRLNVYNSTAGTQAYDFDPAGTGQNAFKLSTYANPQPWCWQDLGGLGPEHWCPLSSSPSPLTPWDLTSYLDWSQPGREISMTFQAPVEMDIWQPWPPSWGGPGAPPGVFWNTDYWLKKFKIEELVDTDVPPDGTVDAPTGAIHAKINAVMYAENGCFFVIPAPYFYEDATGSNVERFLRYNYDIEIRGAITENFHPRPAAVREWQEKWAFPDPAGGWNSIRYVYDETILAAREQATTTLTGPIREASTVLATNAANLPKLPLLPVSPDLIYYGE